MRRTLLTLFALTLALATVMPVSVTAQDDVLVVGQHAITLTKGDKNGTATLSEAVHYTVDEEFSGTLQFDLDPQANFRTWFINLNGTPIPTDAGRSANEPLPSEDVDGFKRFTLDLSAHNTTFLPDRTYTVHLFYSLPGDDREFTRRLSTDTPQLGMVIHSTPGLEASMADARLDALGASWTYTLSGEDQGPWEAGDTLTVTFSETDVPRTPLNVDIESNGRDPVRLTANAEGGIAPYSYSWDTDGDGECDDESGQTVDLRPSEVGTHGVTVCVADAREGVVARETYEVRVVEGPTVTTGPGAWLLALVGLVVGALLVYGLIAGGIVQGRRGGGAAATTTSSGRSLAAESKDMLSMRQRVMVAALKELEIAKKKGEVPEGLYTPLKAELKQDTVRVMRELEKRKSETV